MATDTQTGTQSVTVTGKQWAAGAAGGLVGSIPFGLMMLYVMPPPLLEIVIPAMYGIQGPAVTAGWALHLFHGVVLGLAYVAIVEFGGFEERASGLSGALGLAVAYGVVTTAILAVLVMPIWLSAVGFPNAPPFPNFSIPGTIVSGIGHVIYAIPVAVGYAAVTE